MPAGDGPLVRLAETTCDKTDTDAFLIAEPFLYFGSTISLSSRCRRPDARSSASSFPLIAAFKPELMASSPERAATKWSRRVGALKRHLGGAYPASLKRGSLLASRGGSFLPSAEALS
jgi:hypothetical protein